MNTKKIILGLFAAVLTFTSCSDDEGVNFQPVALGAYENGIIVNNEGNFLQGNASTSFVSNDLSIVNNGIFTFHNNNAPLGDTAQSMAFYNNLAYIIVNGSNKVEIVNRYTFVKEAAINTGLEQPRYMTFANGKGYITNWGDGADANDDYVAVIDLATNTISSTIPVGEGPEQIVFSNGNLYISHKGGWGSNNIVTSIDVNSNAATTITLDNKPDEIVLDAANNIWVLSEGDDLYDGSWNIIGRTTASLNKINTTTNVVDATFVFATGVDPKTIAYDNGLIYFYANSKIYKLDETDTALPTTSIIDQELYQGLAVKNGYIYGTTTNFTAGTGELVIYDASTYTLVDTKTLNVGSSKIYFN